MALKWKKSSLFWLLKLGQKGYGQENGTQNKKRSMVEPGFFRESDVETSERTCRSGDVWDPRFRHQVATVAHLDS